MAGSGFATICVLFPPPLTGLYTHNKRAPNVARIQRAQLIREIVYVNGITVAVWVCRNREMYGKFPEIAKSNFENDFYISNYIIKGVPGIYNI